MKDAIDKEVVDADIDVSAPVATKFASAPPPRRKVPSALVMTDSVQLEDWLVTHGWAQ